MDNLITSPHVISVAGWSEIAASPTEKRSFRYSPALDVLRGVAVLTVMLYHLSVFSSRGLAPIPAGFLGVDVFFVLSGFLITSVLLREDEVTGSISLMNFYLRRIFRLVPAYWLFLALLYSFGRLILPNLQASIIYSGNKFLFAALYLTNWNSAYGEAAGNLNHTWSLAIEEQFYLLWPLFLVGLVSLKFKRHTILALTAALIIGLLVLRAVLATIGIPVQVLYYSTESRIDSILIGCAASLIYMWRMIPDRYLESEIFRYLTVAAVGFAISIVLSSGLEDINLYRVYLPVFTLAIASLILVVETRSTAAFKFLFENPVLCWIGKISYGLYLWHYLSFEIANQLIRISWLAPMLGFAITFAVATLSYYLLEKRFLKLKRRFESGAPAFF